MTPPRQMPSCSTAPRWHLLRLLHLEAASRLLVLGSMQHAFLNAQVYLTIDLQEAKDPKISLDNDGEGGTVKFSSAARSHATGGEDHDYAIDVRFNAGSHRPAMDLRSLWCRCMTDMLTRIMHDAKHQSLPRSWSCMAS